MSKSQSASLHLLLYRLSWRCYWHKMEMYSPTQHKCAHQDSYCVVRLITLQAVLGHLPFHQHCVSSNSMQPAIRHEQPPLFNCLNGSQRPEPQAAYQTFVKSHGLEDCVTSTYTWAPFFIFSSSMTHRLELRHHAQNTAPKPYGIALHWVSQHIHI